jgi:hypothetical protein
MRATAAAAMLGFLPGPLPRPSAPALKLAASWLGARPRESPTPELLPARLREPRRAVGAEDGSAGLDPMASSSRRLLLRRRRHTWGHKREGTSAKGDPGDPRTVEPHVPYCPHDSCRKESELLHLHFKWYSWAGWKGSLQI